MCKKIKMEFLSVNFEKPYEKVLIAQVLYFLISAFCCKRQKSAWQTITLVNNLQKKPIRHFFSNLRVFVGFRL